MLRFEDMPETTKDRVLRLLAKGQHPDAASLGLSKEQYVKVVSEMKEEGLIDGVYISFCDNYSGGNLLEEAVLTEKGKVLVPQKRSFFSRLRKGS